MSGRVDSDSAGRGRVELCDQPVEGVFQLRLVLIGVSADEVDDLPVTLGGVFVIAARFVDHPEPVVAVVHFGVANQQVACGGLGSSS